MGRPRALLATGIATAALTVGAACGDDEALSPDDYRAQLDAACERLTDEFTRLPQVVQDENLEMEDAQALADEAGSAFNDDVAALEPPDELADAHGDLLAAFEDPPPEPATPVDARERALKFADLYDAVGAEGCAAGQRATASLIERGIENSAP